MKIIFLATCILTLILSAFSQSDSTFFDNRARVESWIQKHNVPALGIAVIRDGKIRELRMYGEIQKSSPAPFNAIFNVASLTKPVVSVLTYKLVKAGVWNLDEPLYKYWVDPDVAKDPRHKKLTTRMILSHQTGFKNWRWLNADKKLAFDHDPGTKLGYSGEGFEYLRKALEKKFKKTIDKLADSILFKPLGMTNTWFAWNSKVDASRFAHWFDTSGREHPRDFKLTNVNAADDLLTTVEDYARFVVHVIDGAGLDTSVFNQMVRPVVPTGNGTYMTGGWERFQDLGPDKLYAILHSGSDAGTKTLAIMVPQLKEGLVIFMNGDNGYMLYQTILTELLSVGEELFKNRN